MLITATLLVFKLIFVTIPHAMRLEGDRRNPNLNRYNTDLLTQQFVDTSLYKQVIHTSITATTMDDVRALALAGNLAPFAEIADYQTRGIGREGRVWHARKDASIMFSVFLPIEEDAIGESTDIIALKAAMVIEETTGIPVRIKWPNDLVVNNKKLAGILPHPLYDQANNFLGVNVGFGMNVHYGKKALKNIPAEYPPTSLDVEMKGYVFRPTIATKLLEAIRFAGEYGVMIRGNSREEEKYNALWRQYSSLLGKNVVITQYGKPVVEGKVIDTQIGNGLFVQTENGIEQWAFFDSQTKVRLVA